MDSYTNFDPFPFICNNDTDDDNKETELVLMGKSESKNSTRRTNSKMMSLEVEDQGKSETMDNADVSMLNKNNYQQWK